MSLIEDFKKENLVISLISTNVTPLLMGNYNSEYEYTNDLNTAIAKAIRGSMRSWSRKLLIKYVPEEKGSSMKNLNKLLTIIFGSTKVSSIFNIEVNVLSNQLEIVDAKEKDVLKLVSMKKDIKLIAEGSLKINVKLYINRNFLKFDSENDSKPVILKDTLKSNLYKFLISSLIGCLLFEGIGGRTSRGYGRFKIIRIVDVSEDYLISEVSRLINGDFKIPNELNKHIINFINVSISLISKLLTGVKSSSNSIMSTDETPYSKLYPTFSLGRGDYELCVFKLRKNIDIYKVLKAIEKCVLKSSWKKIKYSGNIKRCGREFETWILGLPRSSSIKYPNKPRNRIKYGIDVFEEEKKQINKKRSVKRYKLLTGYYKAVEEKNQNILKPKILRHKSPLQFTVYEGVDDKYIVLFMFKNLSTMESLGNDKNFIRIGLHRVKHKNKRGVKECIEINRYGYRVDDECRYGVSRDDVRDVNNLYNKAIKYVYECILDDLKKYSVVEDDCFGNR